LNVRGDPSGSETLILDEQMEGDPRYFYRRYMDDVIVLAKTRWHLRKAVRTVNQHFNQLKVEQAPDKTFIGKIRRGWDFLGYHFDGKQLTVAAKTVEKHVLHYRQLYEQLRNKKATSDEMALALGQYVKRWQRWVKAGIGAWVTPQKHRTYHCAWSSVQGFNLIVHSVYLSH